MTTSRGPIPVTVGTFEAYHWWRGGGDTIGGGGGLGTQNAEPYICVYIELYRLIQDDGEM